VPTSRPPLSYDVFVTPAKPAKAPPPRVGESPAWDPTTSTLIFGAHDAVLVDSLMTVREATALADWIALHERRLTTIYITHGHGDHYSGLSVVLDRFPDALAVATKGTVEQMRVAYNHCHIYVGATTADSRSEWTASLDRLAALHPTAVVTGHKDPTQGNPPSVLTESQEYIQFYGKLPEADLTDQGVFDAMVSRHPDWVSRQQLLILG
jgi:metal-dependent hydrolase (beta-lactamase superfamily II)